MTQTNDQAERMALLEAKFSTPKAPIAPAMDTPVVALGKKLKAFREENGLSLRDVEAATGICNPTLHRIEHGKATDYSTGKVLEQYLSSYVLPREWKILYRPCDHKYGIVSSHVCKEWYVEGPPTGELTITVREVRATISKAANNCYSRKDESCEFFDGACKHCGKLFKPDVHAERVMVPDKAPIKTPDAGGSPGVR